MKHYHRGDDTFLHTMTEAEEQAWLQEQWRQWRDVSEELVARAIKEARVEEYKRRFLQK